MEINKMKKLTKFIMLCFILHAELSVAILNDKEALILATEAYIYGYPLITMDMTRKVMTNVTSVEAMRGPMGQFVNAREYPNATFRDVTAPNADTLYSSAWLDLSEEPYILHVPDEKGRYYLMPMLSGWTEVFAVPGKRTTGTQVHDFAIVGPHWSGSLPKGMTELKSPTNMVWILGRTYCTGTPEDYKAVHSIQDEYKLMPLSYYGKPYTPPKGKVESSIDMKTPVRDQVNALDAPTYFKKLAELMKNNPPSKEDALMVAKLEKLGIIPGQDFDLTKAEQSVAKALHQSVKQAQMKIMAHEKKAGVDKNGWTFATKTGLYGTDYLQRAFVSAVGLGANKPQDAIYPTTTVDKAGKKLNGTKHYVMHFAKGQMPPVKGFWSLTMYNDNYFFIENPLNRYTLSSRSEFKKNSDGSIDIYIQHESPGNDKESNWLPAPEGNFILMLRFYWPKDAIINGKWSIPAVELIK
jgi:DNA sulfur modification protein DndE